jgi:PII-like signaling protein
MGFGAHSRVHTFKIERLSLDLPIIVELVDTREKLERFLAFIDNEIAEGLATLEKAQIHFYRSGQCPVTPIATGGGDDMGEQ